MRLLTSTILALSLGAIGVHCCAPMPIGTPLNCHIRDCRKDGCKDEPIKCSLNQPVEEKYVSIGKTPTDNELFCEKDFKPEKNYSIWCETKANIQYADVGLKLHLPTEMSSCKNDRRGRPEKIIMVEPPLKPKGVLKVPKNPPPKPKEGTENPPPKPKEETVEPPPKPRRGTVEPPPKPIEAVDPPPKKEETAKPPPKPIEAVDPPPKKEETANPPPKPTENPTEEPSYMVK